MKNIFSSSFYQRVFFGHFVDRKVVGLMLKDSLHAGRYKPGFYFVFLA